jgi:multiple sugar transport system ATP-binding protein
MNTEAKGVELDLQGLGKTFSAGRRTVAAVAEVNLRIEPGEFFILLGPSGCGKSTLLNLLAGLEWPTLGSIRMAGETVADPSRKIVRTPKERNVAMVFQSYALYPHLTVGENIAFPLRVSGTPAAEINPAVLAAARAVEMEEWLESRPGELSGGQRQRAAIARALVRKPALLLLDEPLSNLDARLRSATRGRIKALQRELGVTTVYVTHDQQEAMALGYRVAVLRKGRIEQIGAPRDLYDHPASAFVARFAGTPPMNLLRAKPSREADGGWKLQTGALEWILPPAFPMPQISKAGTVLLGLRPEHGMLFPASANQGIPARVAAAERWGRETLWQLSSEKLSFSVLGATGAAAEGENVRVHFDLERARVFSDDGEE